MDNREISTEIIFVRHGESTENVAAEEGHAYDANNIILTKRGELQARITGDYLKMYGQYDIIYHSPATRCVQTKDIIANELNCEGDVIETNLILELGFEDKLRGLSRTDRLKHIENNTKYKRLSDLIENEKNLFKKEEYQEQMYQHISDFLEQKPSLQQHIQDSKKFLDLLKSRKGKRILVICHGGTIFTISRLVTNLNPNQDNVSIILKEQTTYQKDPEPVVERDNCCIMGLLLKDNVFHLVIPRNALHLKSLSEQIDPVLMDPIQKTSIKGGKMFNTTTKTKSLIGIHISRIDDVMGNIDKHFKNIDLIQIFVNATTNYNDKKYTDAVQYLQKKKIKLVVHGSYSINLAKRWTETDWWIQQFIGEIKVSHQLGSFGIVIHTGKQLDLTTAEALNNMYTALLYTHQKTEAQQDVRIIIETPSGQGTETLTEIYEFCRFMKKFYMHPNEKVRQRFGICVDTCHIFAAGNDIRDEKSINQFFGIIDKTIGIEKIKLCQINDSKKGLGEHLDRHENIGIGKIGKQAIGLVVEFMKELEIPIVLETPDLRIRKDYEFLKSI